MDGSFRTEPSVAGPLISVVVFASGDDAGHGGPVNKKYIVRLFEEERAELRELVRKGAAAAHKRTHAQILLKADQDKRGVFWTDVEIADALDVHTTTVAGVRKRFVEEGLEAAINRRKQRRPSKVRMLDGEKEARLLALACGEPPEGRARWTLHLLADELVRLEVVDSISYQTVRRALKKTS